MKFNIVEAIVLTAIIGILFLLFYIGTSEAYERRKENPQVISAEPPKPKKNWTTQMLENYAEYGEYDGHQYLVVSRHLRSNSATMCMTHSPKCWCLTNNVHNGVSDENGK